MTYSTIILGGSFQNDFKTTGLSDTCLQFKLSEEMTILEYATSKQLKFNRSLVLLDEPDYDFFKNILQIENLHLRLIRYPTSGALTTLALGIDFVEDGHGILVIPGDCLMPSDLESFVDFSEKSGSDLSILCFPSVKPQYSYLRLVNDEVIELNEKKQVGKYATSGYYFFKNKSALLETIKWALLLNTTYNKRHYISLAVNYFISINSKISIYKSSEENYFRFSTPEEAIDSKRRFVIQYV
jgi:hypothetical protein